jgi:hypothetical protein
MGAFAKEAGRFARVWREGEIVAVDGRGNIHRLDHRTTGDLQPEIETRQHGKPVSSPLMRQSLSQGRPMAVRAEDAGESEGRPVMGQIGKLPVGLS